jgi:quercetin dioxygenase-like cupin family protein
LDNFLQLELRRTGETLRMRRVRDSQGQTVLTMEGSLPPRASGPPLHVHFRQREEGIVKAGTLGAQVGTEKIIVRTGGTAVLPAGVVHKWWNAGDDLLELSGRTIPAGDLDRYLQAIFAVLNASPSGRRVDLLHSTRSVAAPSHAGACDASTSYSACDSSSHSFCWPRPGQVPWR